MGALWRFVDPWFSFLPCAGGGRLRLPCKGLLGWSRRSLLPCAGGGRLCAALRGIVQIRLAGTSLFLSAELRVSPDAGRCGKGHFTQVAMVEVKVRPP